MRPRLRLLAAALLLALGLHLGGCAQGPGQAAEESAPAINAPGLPSPAPRTSLEDVRVYFDGLLADKGYRVEDTVYLAPDALCRFFNLELKTYSDREGFRLELAGMTLSGKAGEQYMQADGRYLFLPYGYLAREGRLYLPWDAIQRIFGLDMELLEDPLRLEINTNALRLLHGGENYYLNTFRVEDLYWLSHIIHAESYLQPLAGQIGVGNVVLNRVESKLFPDSIMLVVLQQNPNVTQFDPVKDGSITSDPDDMSSIAAYLCLEGYNTVGDCMYFVNPARGDATWFRSTLHHVITIGDHEFYNLDPIEPD